MNLESPQVPKALKEADADSSNEHLYGELKTGAMAGNPLL